MKIKQFIGLSIVIVGSIILAIGLLVEFFVVEGFWGYYQPYILLQTPFTIGGAITIVFGLLIFVLKVEKGEIKTE